MIFLELVPVADAQNVLEEKVTVEEKLAITEYELRLAQEDLSRLREELQKQKQYFPDDLNGPFLMFNIIPMICVKHAIDENVLDTINLQ